MIEIVGSRRLHEGWASFAVYEVRLDGGAVIHREVEDHGSAVAVLVYDETRRCALLVEQLRVPMLVAAGVELSTEVPAGLVESDDTETCARREVMEECGLRLGRLEPVARCWSMPGISTERIDLYLASYRDIDRVGAGGGLDAEHENITLREIALADLAAEADRGLVTDMKTLLLLQTLRLRRPDLFGPAIC